MAVAGIANGVYHPADYAILSASVTEARMGRAFSLHTFTGFAGFAVVPLTIITLSGWFGWQAAVAACGVAGIAAAGLLVVFGYRLQHSPGSDKRRKPGDAAPAKGSGFDILFRPAILMCMLFFTLLALSSGGINNFLVSALNAVHDVSLADATQALTGYLVGSSLGILLGGMIADRTSNHNLVAACCFLVTGVAILAVGLVAMPPLVLTAVMVGQGMTHGIIMPSRDMIVRVQHWRSHRSPAVRRDPGLGGADPGVLRDRRVHGDLSVHRVQRWGQTHRCQRATGRVKAQIVRSRYQI